MCKSKLILNLLFSLIYYFLTLTWFFSTLGKIELTLITYFQIKGWEMGFIMMFFILVFSYYKGCKLIFKYIKLEKSNWSMYTSYNGGGNKFFDGYKSNIFDYFKSVGDFKVKNMIIIWVVMHMCISVMGSLVVFYYCFWGKPIVWSETCDMLITESYSKYLMEFANFLMPFPYWILIGVMFTSMLVLIAYEFKFGEELLEVCLIWKSFASLPLSVGVMLMVMFPFVVNISMMKSLNGSANNFILDSLSNSLVLITILFKVIFALLMVVLMIVLMIVLMVMAVIYTFEKYKKGKVFNLNSCFKIFYKILPLSMEVFLAFLNVFFLLLFFNWLTYLVGWKGFWLLVSVVKSVFGKPNHASVLSFFNKHVSKTDKVMYSILKVEDYKFYNVIVSFVKSSNPKMMPIYEEVVINVTDPKYKVDSTVLLMALSFGVSSLVLILTLVIGFLLTNYIYQSMVKGVLFKEINKTYVDSANEFLGNHFNSMMKMYMFVHSMMLITVLVHFLSTSFFLGFLGISYYFDFYYYNYKEDLENWGFENTIKWSKQMLPKVSNSFDFSVVEMIPVWCCVMNLIFVLYSMFITILNFEDLSSSNKISILMVLILVMLITGMGWSPSLFLKPLFDIIFGVFKLIFKVK